MTLPMSRTSIAASSFPGPRALSIDSAISFRRRKKPQGNQGAQCAFGRGMFSSRRSSRAHLWLDELLSDAGMSLATLAARGA